MSWKDIAPIVQRAIAPVQQSREREGAALVAELERRIGNLQEGLAKVEERSPERAARERDRLREAINTLAAGVTVDETRLAQEVAIIADRIDITEETVRLRTHIDAVHHALNEAGPVGKQLGFLGQEMLRETNTIGSKANDAQIAQLVIAMKGELEKYREQLENIE